ncbi:MarR family transcriptional regulator [Mycolicibacterium agri]|uniref:MarR family transcriptional regulator n=1 Tax=Mycolicibacterium agri TaxID=36811 RepID=A0A2A7NE61_MYCAG|nr:MarR family transcriptional regulator [Mycolicibacterium agri]PEG42063.1 MarR family transcriptional regulator [Mycolicibacterium agri]GFG49770.1 putative HTH-type transcriptional regulator [Mycolicibacterium agri]
MLDMSAFLEDQPLGYLLYRVHTALRAEISSSVLEPLNLAFPQYICMRLLQHFPGRSNAELARDNNVSPQAMNMVVRSLEERGLVTRPTSVASGRSLPAQLTREGKELLKKTDTGVRAAERRLLSRLTDEQAKEFRRMLVVLGSDPA